MTTGMKRLRTMLLLLLVGLCHQAYGSLPDDFYTQAYVTKTPDGQKYVRYPGGLALQELAPTGLKYCRYNGDHYLCNFATTDEVIVLGKLDPHRGREYRISNTNRVLMVLPLCDMNLKFKNVNKIQMGYLRDGSDLLDSCSSDIFTAINSTVQDFVLRASSVFLSRSHVMMMDSEYEFRQFRTLRSTFGHIKTFLSAAKAKPFYFVHSSVDLISNMIIDNNLNFINTTISVIGMPGITLKRNASISFVNTTIGNMERSSLYADYAEVTLQNVIIESADEHAFSILEEATLKMENVTILHCNNCIRHLTSTRIELTNLTIDKRSVVYIGGQIVIQGRNSSSPNSVTFSEHEMIIDDHEENLSSYTISANRYQKTVCVDEANAADVQYRGITSVKKLCHFSSFIVTNESVVNNIVRLDTPIHVIVNSSRVSGIYATASPISITFINATIAGVSEFKMVEKSVISDGSMIQYLSEVSAVDLVVNSSSIAQLGAMIVEGFVHVIHSKIDRIMDINVTRNARLLLEDTRVDFFSPRSVYLAENASFTVLGNPPVVPPWPVVSALSYDQVNLEGYEARGIWLPLLVRLRLSSSSVVEAPPITRVIDAFSPRYCTLDKLQDRNLTTSRCDYAPSYTFFFKAGVAPVEHQTNPPNISTFANAAWLQLMEGDFPDTVHVVNVEHLIIPEQFSTTHLSLTNSSINDFHCYADILTMTQVSCEIFQPRDLPSDVEMTNSTIGQFYADVIHANVTASEIGSIVMMVSQEQVEISHSHIRTIHKYGVFVKPQSSLAIENTTIDEIEELGIVVEGTLALKNIVIRNLKEEAIVLGSIGERYLHFENVTIEKGPDISFLDTLTNFMFKNVTMNGQVVRQWMPEARFKNSSVPPPNDNITDENVLLFTSEGLTVPDDILEGGHYDHGTHVIEEDIEPVLTMNHTVVELMQRKGKPDVTLHSTVTHVTEQVTNPALILDHTAKELKQSKISSGIMFYSALTIIGCVFAAVFITICLLITFWNRRVPAKVNKASADTTIDDGPSPVVVSAPVLQPVAGPAPPARPAPPATLDMTEVDLTSVDAVYGAGGRGLIEPTEVGQNGWSLSPYGQTVEEQPPQQQLDRNHDGHDTLDGSGSQTSGEGTSSSSGRVEQMSVHQDAEEFLAALKNDKKSPIFQWSLAGFVKYSKFK